MARPNGTVSDLISQLKIQHHLESASTSQDMAYYSSEQKKNTISEKLYKNDPSSKEGKFCTYSKKSNHSWKECRKLKNDNERKKQFSKHKRQINRGPHNNDAEESKDTINKGGQSFSNTKPTHTGAFRAKAHQHSQGKFSWIIDSGATNHMTPYIELLENYSEFETPCPITIGDGRCVNAYGSGQLTFITADRCFTSILHKALWVPELSENLFSLCKAMDNGCRVEFDEKSSTVVFLRNNETVLRGAKKEGANFFLLMLLPRVNKSNRAKFALLGATIEDWHRRLGHCSM